jgi:hypothetical protein
MRVRMALARVTVSHMGRRVIVYCAEHEAPAMRDRAPVADLKLVISKHGRDHVRLLDGDRVVNLTSVRICSATPSNLDDDCHAE